MNSRDRVLAAINHEPLDHFPLDIGGPICGISKIAYDNYLKKFAPNLFPSVLCDRFQQLSCVHEEMLKHWKVDTRHVCAKFLEKKINNNSYFDAFGIKHESIFSPHFNQIIYFNQVEWPFRSTWKIEDIENFKWPKLEQKQLDEACTAAKMFHDQDYAAILDPPSGGVLETTVWMVGIKRFFTDLHAHFEFFESLIDHVTNTFYLPYWNEVLSEDLGEWIDIVLIGDDFGMQDRMIISPHMWRKFVKPRLQKVVQTIKELAKVKVQLHSCGSIYPIIPDLIEIGIDVLNPLQPKAQDMDHQNIKTEFGDRICFHGGVDIQEVMPRGSPEEVQQEVQRVFRTLGADGTGYIRATAHNILADVPLENINAYIQASD